MCTRIYTNKCDRINAFFQASFVQAMLNFNSCEYHIWAKARSLSLSLSLSLWSSLAILPRKDLISDFSAVE